MWNLYDTLLKNLPETSPIASVTPGKIWAMAQLENGNHGIAMMTAGTTVPAMLEYFSGLSPSVAAEAIKSWNLEEASLAMSAVNACYNTQQRMEQLHCYEPYENYCTAGLDFTGKTVGIIGHMGTPSKELRQAKKVYILERNPRPGDYPDSACEYLLPCCDAVLITGSSLINKTLPRLLSLCRNAYTIVTGPTVPMCPALLDLGIDRLAGMVVTDPGGIEEHVTAGRPGSPYSMGRPFLLKRN